MRYFLLFSFICILLMSSCSEDHTLFKALAPEQTDITFSNDIPEDENLSILDFEYIYNGGGVGIADFNNDGLNDILFTGNIVDNQLYLNKGDMKFTNISEESGIAPSNRWSTGIAIQDINLDGLLDIYITASGHSKTPVRSNQLFICQEINDDGIPIYKDQTAAYGLVDSSYSTNSSFIDYDKDGDLDLFVINNHMIEDKQASKYRNRTHDRQTPRTDLLFRNDWDEKLGHPVFTDVSVEAGLFEEGFSLGINVHDFNKDGWDDVLITNDYLTTDVLYINQQDGTFKNQSEDYFKHTSFSAMGMDVVDLDNDGLHEVIALDMLPRDNYRRKTMLPPNIYTSYVNNEKYDYQYQHVRNTLQKNNFNSAVEGEEPMFSEQSLIAGIAATDWSWAPIVADFDSDGDRDILVTNGFPKDVTDRDFIDYNMDVGAYATKRLLLPKIPSIKLPNVAFENKGDLKFENANKDWGITTPTFSNGGAYGDLDNDGDLDLVINNINDVASIYQNNNTNHNTLVISVKGPKANPSALSTEIIVTSNDQSQSYHVNPSRGYLSSVDPEIYVGLGDKSVADEIVVYWPDGNSTILKNIDASKPLIIDYNTSKKIEAIPTEKRMNKLFSAVNKTRQVDFIHQESDYNDFNVQPMLLHKLSQYGPGIAVGDANGDGLEDMYISGSHFNEGTFLLQQKDGSYVESFLKVETPNAGPGEELGALFFDADGDGDEDLYIAYGGYEYDLQDSIYQDRFYENNQGKFYVRKDAIPQLALSSGDVSATDIDKDGDLDLVIGSRVLPGQYPASSRSTLLMNESVPGTISFIDVTSIAAPFLESEQMITDILWVDVDNDRDKDMIIVAEFQPIQIALNENGVFSLSKTSLDNYVGWWNSIVGGDFDNDGDTDFIVGNYGDHTLTPISEKHPIRVYFADYDNNGSRDIIPTCWFEDENGKRSEFPYFGRLEYEKQITGIKAKYRQHSAYANATISDILSAEERDSSLVLSANFLKSAFIENSGNGDFTITPLPPQVQLAPIYGMLSTDVNNDGNLDVVMIGNDHGMEISIGRMDAHDGVVLLGDGMGGFTYQHARETGFYVTGDGKTLTTVFNENSQTWDIAAAQNRGPLRLYNLLSESKYFKFENTDLFAMVTFENGNTQKIENHVGGSYWGQGSDYVHLSSLATSVTIHTPSGERIISL